MTKVEVANLKLKAVVNLENPKGKYVDMGILREYCENNPKVELNKLIKIIFK